MLPRFYRKYVPRDTMYPTAPTKVFWYVMLIVRDLIWVLRFPLQEDSGWISLARASQLDYGALAEVSLYLAGGSCEASHSSIHRSAWKGNSANFALTEFSEVVMHA